MKSTTKSWPSARLAFSVRPEWRLILACARVQLDAAQRERIAELLAGQLDWGDVVVTAMRQSVESLLYRHLSSEFSDAVPANAMQSLEEVSRRRSQRALYLTGEMLELLDKFKEAGVLVVPYKGPTLAAMAYGNVALRHSEDLDFAIPQQDMPKAFNMLVAAGFRSNLNPAVARDARLLVEGQIGQYCFFFDKYGALVELHTEKTLRYFPVPLDWEGLRQRLMPVAIGTRRFHTFSIEDTLLLLSVHGAKHFWNRLSWICDIAAIVQAPQEVDWELSEGLARRMGCHRMWLLALSLANEILDAPLPLPVLQQIEGNSQVAALGRSVHAQLFRQDHVHPGALQRFSFRLRSHETWAQGLSQSFRVATQPSEEDHRAYELPEWAAPLYPFLRPWRLLREHGLGLRRKYVPHLAPFVPTPPEVVEQMLRFADVHEGDVLYDIGCGDGRIVVAAAKMFGIRAVGVDIDPERIAEARASARRNGVEHLVEFRRADAEAVDLSPATVVTMFLGVQANLALVGKLRNELRSGARVVSRFYDIPGWPSDDSMKLALPSVRENILYLWRIREGALTVAPEKGVGSAGERV